MEASFLAWLRERVPAHPRLKLGIGDDAALVAWTLGRDCVVTTDMLLDGVDFRVGHDAIEAIGRKALAANLSDLAAMAAVPVAAVIALALPQQGALELAQGLYRGLLPLAAEFDLAMAGGDTNTWEGGLAISITAFGEPTERGPLRRDGARPGDAILVTGEFGGSRLGKQFTFQPRVREALLLRRNYALHAGIDVSDGLSLDLARLCAASQVGAVIDLAAVPIAVAAHEWTRTVGGTETPLDHALGDGEDFELILTLAAEEAARLLAAPPEQLSLARIGTITAERGLRTTSGAPLVARGWEY